jgi:phenol hydroxylase P2 protein
MTQAPVRRPRLVGVDLQDTEENRPIIDAIEQDNPDANLIRMPGMVKLQKVGRLVIRRTTVEEILGREWETHEFQLSIISYVGNISEWDEDQIVIEWEH